MTESNILNSETAIKNAIGAYAFDYIFSLPKIEKQQEKIRCFNLVYFIYSYIVFSLPILENKLPNFMICLFDV